MSALPIAFARAGFMTVQEAADELRVSRYFLTELLRAGQIEHHRVGEKGGRIIVSRESVAAFAAGTRRPALQVVQPEATTLTARLLGLELTLEITGTFAVRVVGVSEITEGPSGRGGAREVVRIGGKRP